MDDNITFLDLVCVILICILTSVLNKIVTEKEKTKNKYYYHIKRKGKKFTWSRESIPIKEESDKHEYSYE